MSVQGVCSKCFQTGSLETAEKICKPCLILKYENYKLNNLPQCARFEAFIDNYKSQIDAISPILGNNLKDINDIKQLVEEAYKTQLNNLNNEKNGLLALLEDCKKDNEKFNNFKNELSTLSQNIAAFKNPSQNLYQDNVVTTLMKKFDESFDKIKNVEQNFQNLFIQPVKFVNRFDPAFVSGKFIGSILIDQTQFQPDNSVLNKLPRMFGPNKSTNHLIGNNNLNGLQKWKQKANDNPFLEIAIDKIPSHLTSFRNYLFCLDDNGILLVFTLSSNNELEYKISHYSPIKKVNSISLSLNYFAMTYHSTDMKVCKTLKINPYGVVLFPRNMDTVELNKPIQIVSEDFKNPIGIALSNEHIFVCDQILKTVFKINIINKQIEATYKVPEGNPYKLSINNEYLVLSDTAQHRLSLHKLSNLEMVNKLDIEQADRNNGPYGVFLSNDNLIFFKNYKSSQLVVVDMYLNNPELFKKIPDGIEGFTMLECVQQFLVVGVVDKKKCKLICYLNN